MKEIFVCNIAFMVSEADLRDFFGRYGVIEECKLITDRVTRKSRGFGFVRYESAESAERAVKEAQNQELKGRPLNVKLSEPREKSGGSGDRGGNGGRRSFGDDSRGG